MQRWTTTGLRTAAPAVGAGLAIGAAFTRPFTLPADTVTALPCVVGALAVVVGFRRHGAGLGVARSKEARSEARSEDRSEDPRSGQLLTGPSDHPRWAAAGTWALPVLVVVLVVGWELVSLAGSPRIEHPTLSSVIDIVTGSRPGKGLAFALWLVAGWWLISRGAGFRAARGAGFRAARGAGVGADRVDDSGAARVDGHPVIDRSILGGKTAEHKPAEHKPAEHKPAEPA
jgi:hypothetical protein